MVKWHFDMTAHKLPESYDYGQPAAAEHVMAGHGIVGTPEQRLDFAKKMHRRPQNMLEYRRQITTILLGEESHMIGAAVVQWPDAPDVLAEWERLDDSGAKEEVADGLPTKQKWARDVYNAAADDRFDLRDRLHAFKLYGEAQGFVGGSATITNIDNRSIILMPQRRRLIDDPEHEAKVISAQARLVTDARK